MKAIHAKKKRGYLALNVLIYESEITQSQDSEITAVVSLLHENDFGSLQDFPTS